MIEKETVLVLGAGASKPYGFPLGQRLIELIGKKGINEAKTYLPKHHQQVADFQRLLRKSDPQSIDEFLEHHPEHDELGRQMIAYHIMRLEDPLKIYTRDDGNWYHHFFHTAFERHWEHFGKNRLSVITFNYDRSFEEYMHQTLTHHFSSHPQDKVVEAIKAIKVVHVYGSIGKLRWQTDDPNNFRDYSPAKINAEEIERAANQLHVIHDQKLEDVEKECHELLANAERIFFFGFSYLEDNMKRLNCPMGDSPVQRQVMGTGLGLTQAEVDYMRRNNDFPVEIPDLSLDIYRFMRERHEFVFHERPAELFGLRTPK